METIMGNGRLHWLEDWARVLVSRVHTLAAVDPLPPTSYQGKIGYNAFNINL